MAGKGSAPGERRGGRQKGTPNKVTPEVRALAQGLFTKAYWTKKREQIEKGECHPTIETKLLAYAYGEPKQEHNVNHGITVTIGYLPTTLEPLTIDAKPVPQIDSSRSLPAAVDFRPESE